MMFTPHAGISRKRIVGLFHTPPIFPILMTKRKCRSAEVRLGILRHYTDGVGYVKDIPHAADVSLPHLQAPG